MPFDGKGGFSRNYNWVNDKNASIPITASRFDADSNDFASGLSLVVTRDGQGPATSLFRIIGSGATAVTASIDNASANLTLNKAGSTHGNFINGYSNGVQRWQIAVGGTEAETGSGVGSNLNINRYNDSGTLIDTPISINRATGVVTITNINVLAGLSAPTSTTNLTLSGSLSVGTTSTHTGVATFNAPSGVRLSVPAGQHALYQCIVAGQRTFDMGEVASGYWRVADLTAGVERMTINASGQITFFNTTTHSAGADPVQATVPANGYCRYVATVTGQRSWYFGCRADGSFSIEDTGSGAGMWVQIAGTGAISLNSSVTIAGNLQVNGSINCSSTIQGTNLYATVSGNAVTYFTSSGVRQWYIGAINNGQFYFTDNSAGIVTAVIGNGNGQWSFNYQTNHTTISANNQIQIVKGSAGAYYISNDSTVQFRWGANGGYLEFFNDSAGGRLDMYIDPNGALVLNSSTAQKVGGGVWGVTSDARIKTVLGSYDLGLDQILQLTPIRYRFKGNLRMGRMLNDPKQEFVGLVAQDMENLFPEMVSKSTGHIDGEEVDDLRTLDTSSLVYALVNAVKTLSARIETLEARR